VAAPFTHLLADFTGVPAAQLRDAGALSGLIVAAAGAAGFASLGAPVIRQMPHDGCAALLLLDGCHIALHGFPERELLLLDVLAPVERDARKAVDVFARRLATAQLRVEVRARG
jgi:S-adenosylmethionine/arginine decarboxylase-like enzyme